MGVDVVFTKLGGVQIDLWWEGLVDVVGFNNNGEGVGVGEGKRDFSISSVFKQEIPRAFTRASSSTIRLLTDGSMSQKAQPRVTPEPSEVLMQGNRMERIWEMSEISSSQAERDIRVTWDEEDRFVIRES